MSELTAATCTPVVSVSDNRGLPVRALNWNRERASDPLRLMVSHSLINDDSRIAENRDPRLFLAWRADGTMVANLRNTPSLAGQVLRRDSTDSGELVTLFDAAGRPVWSRDGRGTVHAVAYDELGRPQSGNEQLSGSDDIRVSWRSDYGDAGPADDGSQASNLRGACVAQYNDGGLHRVNSVALCGTVLSQNQRFLASAEVLPDWPEDEAGREALLETDEYDTLVSPDARGAALSQTDAAGHKLAWRYDVSGHVCYQDVTPAGGNKQTLLAGITWSAAGQVLAESAGNSVTTTYGYDPQNQWLATITVQRTDNATLQSLSYGYDFTGNVTSLSDGTVAQGYWRNQATSGARQFTYDALYQLLSATGRENASNTGMQYSGLPAVMSPDGSQYVNYSRSYAYDDSGNLKTLKHTGAGNFTRTMTTDTLSNRSVQQNDGGPQSPDAVNDWFDSNGNLLSLQASATGSDGLAWDGNNNLQQAILVSRSSGGNDREMYQYSGSQRVRKQTRTLVNGDSQLWSVDEVRYLPGLELRKSWQETAGSSAFPSLSEELHVITSQAGRAGIRVLHWETGKPEDIANDQVRWSVDDNIGSLSLELDSEGQLISREEYYPFGGTAVWAARSEVEAEYKAVRYSGKERDGTGLYYYGHRYYAPWLCRWVSTDPAGEVEGLNLFRMVNNNPVTLQDIGGMAPGDWKETASITKARFSTLAVMLRKNPSTAEAARTFASSGKVLYQNMFNNDADTKNMMHNFFETRGWGKLNDTMSPEALKNFMIEFLEMLTQLAQVSDYSKEYDPTYNEYSKINLEKAGEALKTVRAIPLDDLAIGRLRDTKESAIGFSNILSATLTDHQSSEPIVKAFAISGATAGRSDNLPLKSGTLVHKTFTKRDNTEYFSPIHLQSSGNITDRKHDTEIKVMKFLFEKMQEAPENSYTVEARSYLPVCASCQTVLTWAAHNSLLNEGQTLNINMQQAPYRNQSGPSRSGKMTYRYPAQQRQH